jgi:NADH-quinone oxidoreductase subunit L
VVSVTAGSAEAHETATMLPFVMMAVTTLIAFAGWLTAHYFYTLRPEMPDRVRDRMSSAYTLLLNKYWVDEIYEKAFVQSSKTAGRALDAIDTGVLDGAVVGVWRVTEMGAEGSTWIEKYVIYGGLNIIGYSNHLAARVLRKLQSGLVHHYATILVAGFVILVNLILLFLWLGGGS